jgi:protein TonB
MGKDIDLTSREWRELIFEGKNKEYGAYYLRETSNNRHIKALMVIAALAIVLAIIPRLYTFVSEMIPKDDEQTTSVVLEDFTLDQPKEEEDPLPEEIIIPVQELQNQTQYVAPEIVEKPVDQTEQMQIQETLNEAPAIGKVTVTGGSDEIPLGELTEATEVVAPPPAKVYDYVKEMPVYPGGQAEMMKFIYSKISYPATDLEMGTEGTVMVEFVVSETGKLVDFKVARKVSSGLDAEALRVARLMPAWTPGKQQGQPVRVRVRIPVKFEIQQ